MRSRNRRGEGGKLRAEIVAAAAELLDTGGGERAVTLRAVARTAGIAVPSIYSHFPDRNAILVDVARWTFAGLARRITSAISAADGAGGDRDVTRRAVCRAYLDFAVEHPERYRAMFGGSGCSPELGAAAIRLLAGCVAGDRGGADPAAEAVVLWLGLHGLAHQRTIANSFPWPPDIVERVIFPGQVLR